MKMTDLEKEIYYLYFMGGLSVSDIACAKGLDFDYVDQIVERWIAN